MNMKLEIKEVYIFSPNRPLGHFGLVVAMSVRVSVCLSVPFPCDFFLLCGLVHATLVRGLVHESVELDASLPPLIDRN